MNYADFLNVTEHRRAVCVMWTDSRQPTSEWQLIENFDFDPPVKVASLGYAIHKDETTLVIAQSIGDKCKKLEQVSGCLVIAACCISEIELL